TTNRSWPGATRASSSPAGRFANSGVEVAHAGRDVTLAHDGVARDRGLEGRDVVVAQDNVVRGDVLVEPLAALGAGYRHDVGTAREHPGQRELGDAGALGLGDRLE